ncbi:hypothetical protein D3C86_1618490 [compost metagenome]
MVIQVDLASGITVISLNSWMNLLNHIEKRIKLDSDTEKANNTSPVSMSTMMPDMLSRPTALEVSRPSTDLRRRASSFGTWYRIMYDSFDLSVIGSWLRLFRIRLRTFSLIGLLAEPNVHCPR